MEGKASCSAKEKKNKLKDYCIDGGTIAQMEERYFIEIDNINR